MSNIMKFGKSQGLYSGTISNNLKQAYLKEARNSVYFLRHKARYDVKLAFFRLAKSDDDSEAMKEYELCMQINLGIQKAMANEGNKALPKIIHNIHKTETKQGFHGHLQTRLALYKTEKLIQQKNKENESAREIRERYYCIF